MHLPFFQDVDFQFANFGFHLQVQEAIHLPDYKGSTLRGGFGHVLKSVCCLMPPHRCNEQCMNPKSCAYAYIFETPQGVTPGKPIQSTHLPHPFVIVLPITSQQWFPPGSHLDFQLTLIGKGIEFMPFFVYAFDELGRRGLGKKRGRYQLNTVVDMATQKPIYTRKQGVLSGEFAVRSFKDFLMRSPPDSPQKLRLQFLTPTRILYQNKLIDRLPFDLLIRNLLRRCSLLAQIHCQSSWELDYKSILEFAENAAETVESRLTWYDWERYGPRQKRWMKLGGFVGEVVYRGQIAPFAPLIMLGQYVHIGKNCTFGMGKYQMEWLSS